MNTPGSSPPPLHTDPARSDSPRTEPAAQARPAWINDLPHWHIRGNPYEVGHTLGKLGARTLRSGLLHTTAWSSVMARRNHPSVVAMATLIWQRFPAIWRELQGLADGLSWSFEDILAWNCRGDLLPGTTDESTTLLIPAAEPGTGGREIPLLAHNVDGLPALAGHCLLVTVAATDGSLPFATLAAPASLPGPAFGTNAAGLAVALDPLHGAPRAIGVPRAVLGRAVLGCPDVPAVRQLLESVPRGGSFHLTLGQSGRRQLLSLECTPDRISERVIEEPTAHTNHLTHINRHEQLLPQRIPIPSGHRLLRANALLAGFREPLDILFDHDHARHPILQPGGPGETDRTTLASTVLEIGTHSVRWRVHVGGSRMAAATLDDARLLPVFPL